MTPDFHGCATTIVSSPSDAGCSSGSSSIGRHDERVIRLAPPLVIEEDAPGWLADELYAVLKEI